MNDSEFYALKAHYDAIVPTLATKADIEKLRAEMLHTVAEIHKWMVASMIGLFIGFGGLGIAMGQILKPIAAAAQAAPPQPIILYVSPPVPPEVKKPS
ncbi:hypothetical protein GTP23_05130 [Pseudoduganella sp. FT93W]|uniref:Uncharacterized protein n=1 Tax=Duganella fentianensis TaxID=2692177 RepID=A0A845I009_9BURK|nr:hypothetical protein [Duganella fentianensis]MYN44456.1 hypothetical protein [Duganella fentianensis]